MKQISYKHRNALYRVANVVGFLLGIWFVHQVLITSSDSNDDQREEENEPDRHQQKTSVTSAQKYLPAFCVRCTSKPVSEELNQQEQCAIVDNNKVSWALYQVNHSSESFVPEWYFSWSKHWQSFPIVKIDPATNKTEFFKEVTDFDAHFLYARYLIAPALIPKNLQYDSTCWRLNLTSSIFARMKSYEFPFEYWTLYKTWISGQKQRFEKHFPWSKLISNVFCEELNPSNVSDLHPEVFNQWRKLADALNETGDKIWERFDYGDVSYPHNNMDVVLSPMRELLVKYLIHIYGKRGLVLGSRTPWLEYELWRENVSHITTMDYVDLGKAISANHPRMRYMNPKSLEDGMIPSSNIAFDFAIAYSSIEHIGLGRFNDPLNPDGDLMELAKLSCLVKPGGFLFIAVPPVETDCVIFNMHRLYGPIRYPMLTECWKVVEFQSFNTSNTDCDSPWKKCEVDSSFTHPWFVLQNLRGCSIRS